MRMKILIICNCATGLEIFRGMLIRKLVKEGNVVTAIVPQTNDKKEKDAEDGLKKMRCNLIRIPIERRGMNPFRDIQLFLEYYRTVKKIKPELVITYTIKPNIYGGLVCRLLKIPYVANITGLGTAFQNKGLLCHMVSGMYKLALKNAKVVFIGPCAAKKLEAMRKSVRSEVDFVLTFEEMMGIFEAKDIDVASLTEEVEGINDASEDGRNFAVSGGVAQSVVNVIQERYPEREIKIANAEGLRDCRKLLMMAKAGKYNGYLLEGMGCPGGCVAGAGTMQSIKKSQNAVKKYAAQANHKNSNETEYVKELNKLVD